MNNEKEQSLAKSLEQIWDFTTAINEKLPQVAPDAYVDLAFSDFTDEIFLQLYFHPETGKEPQWIPLITHNTDLDSISVDFVIEEIERFLS